MNALTIRKYLINALIGCLVALGGVAIIAVLIGGMTDLVWRSVGTIFSAVIHIAIILIAIPVKPPVKATTPVQVKRNSARSLMINVVIGLATASLVTSTLGVWSVIDSLTTSRFISSYFVVLLAAIYALTFYYIEIVNAKMHYYAQAVYGIVTVLAAIAIAATFEPRLMVDNFMLGRIMLALAIALIVITLVVAILHHVYLQNHPELNKKEGNQPVGAGRIFLIIIFILVVIPILSRFIFALFYIR